MMVPCMVVPVALVLCVLSALVKEHDCTLQGHLKPFGEHRDSEGDVTEIQGFPSAEEFYNSYITLEKPVVFRGAVLESRMFQKWNDKYLASKFGHHLVEVEINKKENRSDPVTTVTLSEFIAMYQMKDWYMVHNAPDDMLKDVPLFKPLCCGGLDRMLQSIVLWMSSGGTKSVFHNDQSDNINCVLDGQKRIIFVDQIYEEQMQANGFVVERGYSTVDVDAVDYTKYPRLHELPWWSATLYAGDCVYIPSSWYHIVHTPNHRSLAINVWFSRLHWFNAETCILHSEPTNKDSATCSGTSATDTATCTQDTCTPDTGDSDTSCTQHIHTCDLPSLDPAMLDEEFAAQEEIRSHIFSPFSGQDVITLEDMVNVWEEWQNMGAEVVQQLFTMMDSNRDMQLEWFEVYEADMDIFMSEFKYMMAEGEEEEYIDLFNEEKYSEEQMVDERESESYVDDDSTLHTEL